MSDDENHARPLCFSKTWNRIHGTDVSSANFRCLKTSTPRAPSNNECLVVAVASLSHLPFLKAFRGREDITVNIQKGLKIKF